MSTPNPHHGQDAAILLSRTYVFAAFGGRWPEVAFLNLRYMPNLAGCPSGPPYRFYGKNHYVIIDGVAAWWPRLVCPRTC